MRAIVVSEFGESDVLTYTEVTEPVPNKDQVMVRLHAAGINPVETYIRAGAYKNLPALPYVPGSDGAGIIEEVGDKVTEFQVGDRVYVSTLTGYGTGTYAEKLVCDVGSVYPLPEMLTFEEGAAIGSSGLTAIQALFQKADSQPGDIILVHGASGGVGSLVVQLAKQIGAVVIATAGSEKGLELLKRLGADVVLNHHSDNYLAEVMTVTGGQGVTVVIEMLANVNLQNDLELMAQQGRIIIVGNRGDIEINPRLIMNREIQISGMLLMNMTAFQKRQNDYRLVAALKQGVKPVIDQVFLLADAQQAQEKVMAQRGSLGKIVLKIS